MIGIIEEHPSRHSFVNVSLQSWRKSRGGGTADSRRPGFIAGFEER